MKILRVLSYLLFWWRQFSFLICLPLSSFSGRSACSCACLIICESSASEFHVSWDGEVVLWGRFPFHLLRPTCFLCLGSGFQSCVVKSIFELLPCALNRLQSLISHGCLFFHRMFSYCSLSGEMQFFLPFSPAFPSQCLIPDPRGGWTPYSNVNILFLYSY